MKLLDNKTRVMLIRSGVNGVNDLRARRQVQREYDILLARDRAASTCIWCSGGPRSWRHAFGLARLKYVVPRAIIHGFEASRIPAPYWD